MDVGKLKQRLQDHFTDGLVTVVGAGLSAAEKSDDGPMLF